MTTKFTTDDFGPKFDEALACAEHGEEVVVQRNGEEVARIVPARHTNGYGSAKVIFGSARGSIELAEGWDAPLSESETADWEGGPLFPSAT